MVESDFWLPERVGGQDGKGGKDQMLRHTAFQTKN